MKKVQITDIYFLTEVNAILVFSIIWYFKLVDVEVCGCMDIKPVLNGFWFLREVPFKTMSNSGNKEMLL